jgi:hypothetical protein
LSRNNEAWRGFFKLLELKREERLPPSITWINPPGYRKRDGSRTLWAVSRKDQYRMDGDEIIFKWLGAIGWIEVRCNGDGCGVRISRGLFRCTRLNKVFNADLASAYNILVASITSSPERGRGNGLETRPRAQPPKEEGCSPNLPIQDGEGGR